MRLSKNVKADPNPAEADSDDFGLPVVYYRLSALIDGHARLRLLDDCTDWEVDLHSPQWIATGIELDPGEFAGKMWQPRQSLIRRVEMQSRDSHGDHPLRLSVSSGESAIFSEDRAGIVDGFIARCYNADLPAGAWTEAFLAAELRKTHDGKARWYVALLRNSPGEFSAKIDEKELIRLPPTKSASAESATRMERL